MNDLDAVMDEIGRPSDPERFTVEDDNAADWVMRKAAKATATIAKIDAMADERIDKVQRWAKDAKSTHEATLGWARGLLYDYHARQLAADPKRKTLDLPSGRVKARNLKATATVEDVDSFVAWAEANGAHDAIKVSYKPVMAEVKKATKVVDGRVIDPATGEVVPGLGVREGRTTYTVEVDP